MDDSVELLRDILEELKKISVLLTSLSGYGVDTIGDVKSKLDDVIEKINQ